MGLNLCVRVLDTSKPCVLLYSTQEQGFSFDLLCTKIIGYEGPILFRIQDDQNNVFGFVSDDVWENSNEMTATKGRFYFIFLCFHHHSLLPDFYHSSRRAVQLRMRD